MLQWLLLANTQAQCDRIAILKLTGEDFHAKDAEKIHHLHECQLVNQSLIVLLVLATPAEALAICLSNKDNKPVFINFKKIRILYVRTPKLSLNSGIAASIYIKAGFPYLRRIV